MKTSLAAAVALQLLLCPRTPDANAAQHDGIVETKAGPVQGVAAGPITEYLGIPYAAPPVGDLRWRPPQAPKPWSAVRNASGFGNRCPQTAVGGEFSAPSASEDCLFLNVFVPASRRGEKPLAVMFWIPGGGFFAGGSNDYDATSLVASGDVVLVTINYRIGLLGFFAQSNIDAEGHAVANYGLLDQRYALAWVRDNISAFGGDRDNVTIFGESTGAISIYGHLASPSAKGLLHKAILQSGFTDYARGPLPNLKGIITPFAGAEATGDRFAAAVGCTADVAACLRHVPVQDIIDRQMPFLSGLAVDGLAGPPLLDQALSGGAFNHVPVINGTNRDEWRWVLAATELRTGKPLTSDGYLGALGRFFGDASLKVPAEYPLDRFGSPSEALAAAETDAYFSCNALRSDGRLARHVPVYGYEFRDADAPMYMPSASFPTGLRTQRNCNSSSRCFMAAGARRMPSRGRRAPCPTQWSATGRTSRKPAIQTARGCLAGRPSQRRTTPWCHWTSRRPRRPAPRSAPITDARSGARFRVKALD